MSDPPFDRSIIRGRNFIRTLTPSKDSTAISISVMDPMNHMLQKQFVLVGGKDTKGVRIVVMIGRNFPSTLAQRSVFIKSTTLVGNALGEHRKVHLIYFHTGVGELNFVQPLRLKSMLPHVSEEARQNLDRISVIHGTFAVR